MCIRQIEREIGEERETGKEAKNVMIINGLILYLSSFLITHTCMLFLGCEISNSKKKKKKKKSLTIISSPNPRNTSSHVAQCRKPAREPVQNLDEAQPLNVSVSLAISCGCSMARIGHDSNYPAGRGTGRQ